MKTFRLACLLAAALAAGTVHAQVASKIKIGLVSTLSGPNGAIGEEIRDAFNLAVQLNNGSLGGVPVEMVIGDDQFNPQVGKQLFERMVKRDKVDFMTGVVFSNIMLASLPEAVNEKVFYISPNAAPSPLAGKDCNPFFFAASWPNDAYHESAGQHATTRGFKNAYLIAPNYQAGKDSLAGFKRFYKGKVVDEVYTKLGQLDYSAELAQVRAAKPEVLYAFLPGGMGVNFIKQFVAAGLNKDIKLVLPGFGADQDIIRGVGDVMLGIQDTAHWALDINNAANKKFVSEYEKAYKRLPTVYAAQGYDTALILDAAIRSVKGNIGDKDAMRKAFREVKFDSVRGSFKFNTNHYPIQNYYLREVKKDSQGRLVNLLASATPIMSNHGDAYVQECTMR